MEKVAGDAIQSIASCRTCRKQVISLESQIKELTERLITLESRLNQNSRNSSKPPSTDYFAKGKHSPRSLREKSGKKPGGQEGHPGTTLEMVDNPE